MTDHGYISVDLVDARSRVEAMESFAQMVCQAAKKGPAEGVITLLVAAVHITMRSGHSGTELSDVMEAGLKAAIAAAENWFGDEHKRKMN